MNEYNDQRKALTWKEIIKLNEKHTIDATVNHLRFYDSVSTKILLEIKNAKNFRAKFKF